MAGRSTPPANRRQNWRPRCAGTSTTSPSSAASPATPCCPTAGTCSATCCSWPCPAGPTVAEITAADVSDFLADLRTGLRRPPAAGRVVGRPGGGRGARLAPVPARRGHGHRGRLPGRPAADAGPPAAQGAAGQHRHRAARGGVRRRPARAAGPRAAGAAVRDRRPDQRGRRAGRRRRRRPRSRRSTDRAPDHRSRCRSFGCAARVARNGWCRSARTRSRAVQAYLVRGRPALAAARSAAAGPPGRCS